jgi:hypothetical protein
MSEIDNFDELEKAIKKQIHDALSEIADQNRFAEIQPTDAILEAAALAAAQVIIAFEHGYRLGG